MLPPTLFPLPTPFLFFPFHPFHPFSSHITLLLLLLLLLLNSHQHTHTNTHTPHKKRMISAALPLFLHLLCFVHAGSVVTAPSITTEDGQVVVNGELLPFLSSIIV